MYNQFYSFSENPFNVTPDPKFLFLTASHREALASMVYGINQRKGFISIAGEVGTGKTTLIHHLLQTLDPQIKAVFIYQTHITFEDLLRNVLLELELKPGDQNRAALMRQLNDYLIQKLALDENLVLFIDEAQNLSREILEDIRMLSNLETANFKLVQIVFVGQPEFEEKLNTPELRQLKQRVGIRREILPLADSESRQYIDHRLKLVGSGSSLVFTEEALAFVIRYAEGVPRTINMVCDNAFLIGFSASKKKIDETIIREVLTDMGILETKKAIHRPQPKDPGPKPTPPSIADRRSSSENKSSTVDRGPSTVDHFVDRGPSTVDHSVDRGPLAVDLGHAGTDHDSWADNKDLKRPITPHSSPVTASVDRGPSTVDHSADLPTDHRPLTADQHPQTEPAAGWVDLEKAILDAEYKTGSGKAEVPEAGPKVLDSRLAGQEPRQIPGELKTLSPKTDRPDRSIDKTSPGFLDSQLAFEETKAAGYRLDPSETGEERIGKARRVAWILIIILCLGLIVFLAKEYFFSSSAEKPPIQSAAVKTPIADSGVKTKGETKPEKLPEAVLAPGAEKDKPTGDPFRPITPSPTTSTEKSSAAPGPKLKKIITVQKGDTLFSILRKHYNPINLSIMDHILSANPKIKNPNLILVDQKIRFPEITADSSIVISASGGYRILMGTYAKSEMINQYNNQPELQDKRIEAVPRTLPSGETWYRITAGDFATKAEALKTIEALKEKGLIPALTGKT